MVLLGAVYAPRAPNGSGALRSCAFWGGCLGGGWLPLPPGVLLWGCFPCLLLLLVLLLVVCCWSRCLLWRCGRSCGAVVRGVRCRPGAVFPGLRGVCRSGAVVGVGVCSGGWAVRGFRAGLLLGRLVCCRRGSWLPCPGGLGRRGRCALSGLCRLSFLGAFGACVRGGVCLSRRGLPREPVFRLTFFAALPFFWRRTPPNAATAAEMRLPPPTVGADDPVRPISSGNAAAAIRRGGYQPPESDHARKPLPQSPPALFPHKGKEGARGLRPPLRRGRGPPDWEIWVSPVSPHYNGRSSPDFPHFGRFLKFSTVGKSPDGVGALTSPVPGRDATGESPKNERRKNHEIRP